MQCNAMQIPSYLKLFRKAYETMNKKYQQMMLFLTVSPQEIQVLGKSNYIQTKAVFNS